MKKQLVMEQSSFKWGKEVKMMKKTIIVLMAAIAVVFAINVKGAQAMASLTIDDGTSSVTVLDSDSDGVVKFDGALGNWIVNVTTGITKPTIGSTTSPSMHLNSVDVSNSAGGSLTITLSDDGFGPFSGTLMTAVGGTTAGTVDFKTYLGSTEISSLAFGGPAFSGTTSAAASFTSSSMTLVATISHVGAGTTSFDQDVQKKVPEPGVMFMFGSGLLALAGFKRVIKK